MSKRDLVSSHFSNDDRRLWEFTRDSKIPYGSFGRGISPDAVVVVVALVALAVGLAAVWV